ncbi:hypothetical protein [Candidatus Magnetaquicoccus inordinatus]|uniref:hypothetical protein n=1 Tax=Candidatus Magnetaquicoccus inordinatus TaxID=2496818 RepID=UPI00102B1B93|nr:hypothetical protein [Candidatus Magnetaquicoccus inordinatus]
MRILLLLSLGLLVVIGLLYGTRLLWRVWHPAPPQQELLDGENGEKPLLSKHEQRIAWLLIGVSILLFLLMIGERLSVDGTTPADWTAPPSVPLHKKSP